MCCQIIRYQSTIRSFEELASTGLQVKIKMKAAAAGQKLGDGQKNNAASPRLRQVAARAVERGKGAIRIICITAECGSGRYNPRHKARTGHCGMPAPDSGARAAAGSQRSGTEDDIRMCRTVAGSSSVVKRNRNGKFRSNVS